MNKSQENIIDTLTDKTIQIFNLKEKEEYIKEVATLEHEEWAENPVLIKSQRGGTLWARHGKNKQNQKQFEQQRFL